MSWWQTTSLPSTAQWTQRSKVKHSKHAARSTSCSLNCHNNSRFSSPLQSSDSSPRWRSLTSPCPSKLATLTCPTDSKFRQNTAQVRQWCRFKVAAMWSKCKLWRCLCPSAFSLLLLWSSRLRHRHYPGKQHLWLLLTCSFHWQESQSLPVFFCVSHDTQIIPFHC